MTDWTGSWAYGYDANNRLTTATPPQPVPNQPARGPYGYDWVGNRLNPPVGTNHMVYNAADQLTAWPGMHQYTYYPDGSLQEEKNTDGSQTMKSYTYTADGLMASASFDGKTLTNTWDGDKNRVGFSVDSANHAFIYDTTAGIPAVVKEDGVYYVREPGGELLARVDGSNTSYYHFDQLGSTRLLTNGSGAVTDKYDYDVYGALIAHDKLADSVDQPYQYVGQSGYYTCWQEPDSGLLQLGVRFYDAEVGRFSQEDSLPRSEVSSYAYVDARMIVAVDPTGRKVEVRLCMIGAVPHMTVCINGVCQGMYPKSQTRAMLNCCVPLNPFGKCCDTGEIRNDTGRDCKTIYSKNTSKSQEERLVKWIDQWKRGFHVWCLVPRPPASDNCWTWAARTILVL